MFGLPSDFGFVVAERCLLLEDFPCHFYELQLLGRLEGLEADGEYLCADHPHQDHAFICLVICKTIQREQSYAVSDDLVDELFLLLGICNVLPQ